MVPTFAPPHSLGLERVLLKLLGCGVKGKPTNMLLFGLKMLTLVLPLYGAFAVERAHIGTDDTCSSLVIVCCRYIMSL